MPAFSTRSRYGAVAQCLHWLTAILVVTAFTFGPGGSEQRVYSSAVDFDRQLHETLGLCVLALVLVRLVWRVFDTRPEDALISDRVKFLSKALQIALYALLVAVPLTAIAGAWLEGHPLTLLGNAAIGPFLAPSPSFGQSIASIHTWLGDAILWVAGGHAAAALYHHFVLKDRVLLSMLPGRDR
ncbi:MAG TPA: cytochrome b/b6 domain-containing protein [Usitatibacter sp.]|nr:cytochrome b/b6 domain-containing protein [Usitatibacter sp.]